MKTFNYILSYLMLMLFIGGVSYGFYKMYQAGYSLAAVILLAIFIVNLVTTAFTIVQVRHSSAKLAWLLVMAVIPLVGHVIFLIFGQRFRYRTSNAIYKRTPLFKWEETNNKLEENNEHARLFNQQVVASKRGVYKGDVQLYKSGHQALEVLWKDIEAAKEFIHIHYYIIKPGEIYEHLKHLLLKKAEEGVEIRLIVDDFGRWAMPWYEINALKKAGIEIGIYGKVTFPFIGSVNGFRTHRKQIIIDGKIVHTGGINIADEYSNLNKKYGIWIDYQTRITGKMCHSHNLLFIQDWLAITGNFIEDRKYIPKLENKGSSSGIMIEDGPRNMEPVMQDAIVKMILNAKKEIKLATPYFIPTPEIFAALRTAAMSGVEISIYVPGKPDKKTVLISTRHYANIMQEYGVKIYEARDMFIHSKIGIFDGEYAYFGTANLDFRSLYSQFEIIELVEGDIVKQISQLFEYYDTLSRELEAQDFLERKLNILQRIFVNIFAPIM